MDPAKRLSHTEFGKPVVIGNNAWIGCGTVICPGGTIVDKTVIGAGSVVTRDISSDMVAGNNSAVVVRSVFDEK